jgi:hypothetical protein
MFAPLVFAETLEATIRSDAPRDVFVTEAAEAAVRYFRRYRSAVVESDDSHAVVTAQFGRYAVTVEITTNGGYRISVTSDVSADYLGKWIANLKKNTLSRL